MLKKSVRTFSDEGLASRMSDTGAAWTARNPGLILSANYLVSRELTSELRREIFLEALFLWRTPFETALSSKEAASLRPFFASSPFLVVIASLTFLIAVLTVDFTEEFLDLLVSLCLCLFIADL